LTCDQLDPDRNRLPALHRAGLIRLLECEEVLASRRRVTQLERERAEPATHRQRLIVTKREERIIRPVREPREPRAIRAPRHIDQEPATLRGGERVQDSPRDSLCFGTAARRYRQLDRRTLPRRRRLLLREELDQPGHHPRPTIR